MNRRKRIIVYLIGFLIFFILFFISLDIFVKSSSRYYIDVPIDQNMEAILVLGCAVWGDEPSPMLKDRLDKAIELYNNGYAGKIIMSGDKTGEDHSEVNTMKKYAIEHGVDSSHIYLDYYGVSTYDSIYRAQNVFEVSDVIVVTQPYHLYRAVYIGLFKGMNVYGVSSEGNNYSGQFKRDIREFLARPKDCIKCIINPKAKYSGELIDIEQSGDQTNDNYMNEFVFAN